MRTSCTLQRVTFIQRGLRSRYHDQKLNTKSKSLSWFLLSLVVWLGSWGSGGGLLVLFTQSPWARRQGAWPGCPPVRAGTPFPSGWPWAEEGWWRTWCGGSWCRWPHSQSASSLRSLCPVWCSLLKKEERKMEPSALHVGVPALSLQVSVRSPHKQPSVYSPSPLILHSDWWGCWSLSQLLKGVRQGYTRY